MGISWVQILVVAVLLILLFGRGRISSLMGDVARGITSFRQGLKEGQKEGAEAPASEETGTTIEGEAVDQSSDKK
jgi:sec-independent protein translocase protein TatA